MEHTFPRPRRMGVDLRALLGVVVCAVCLGDRVVETVWFVVLVLEREAIRSICDYLLSSNDLRLLYCLHKLVLESSA